jgi:penicillin-insensitive murein endopeptidase
MTLRILSAIALTLALAACGGGQTSISTQNQVTRSGIAKQLFGAERVGSPQAAAPYGFYSKGCLAGAEQLAETGPTWQAMRLSRNRNWGHPELIDYLKDLSQRAARVPGYNGIYVGDLSQPRGGPMLTGHASHQIGLDADIWLMPAKLGLSVAERESLSAVSFRRANGAYVNERWGPSQQALVKAAASDPRVARIFIFPGAKVAMCDAETGDRSWLRKVRPWYGHHYHIHVRLACPRGARGCVDQDPPPPGDGCADARQWVANILNPPPPDPDAPKPQPKREITMADLPQQCSAVLSPP